MDTNNAHNIEINENIKLEVAEDTDRYISRAELRIAPYDIQEDDADDKLLDVLQQISKNLIDNVCQQNFEVEGSASAYVEKKISGTGKDTIFLPKRLITLQKIRIYSSTTSYVDYTPDNFMVKNKFISWSSFVPDVINPARFQLENFPEGSYNIGIFGIWGYSSYPNPIKYLQGRLIQKLIDDKSFANKFSSEKIGDYNYSLIVEDDKIFGDPELDMIVRQYRGWINYAVT
jgi:hypothetical protein